MTRAIAALMAIALLPLAACTYPQTVVATPAAPATLAVRDAPPGAVLAVDGTGLGMAAAFGPAGHPVAVPHGSHRVTVSLNGATLYDNTVYFGDDTARSIDLGYRPR